MQIWGRHAQEGCTFQAVGLRRKVQTVCPPFAQIGLGTRGKLVLCPFLEGDVSCRAFQGICDFIACERFEKKLSFSFLSKYIVLIIVFPPATGRSLDLTITEPRGLFLCPQINLEFASI